MSLNRLDKVAASRGRLPELLPKPVPCVSADAAWLAMDDIVTKYVRRIGAGG